MSRFRRFCFSVFDDKNSVIAIVSADNPSKYEYNLPAVHRPALLVCQMRFEVRFPVLSWSYCRQNVSIRNFPSHPSEYNELPASGKFSASKNGRFRDSLQSASLFRLRHRSMRQYCFERDKILNKSLSFSWSALLFWMRNRKNACQHYGECRQTSRIRKLFRQKRRTIQRSVHSKERKYRQ